MMDRIRNKKKLAAGILSVLLIVIALFLYCGMYEKISVRSDKKITIGVFSDSYWEVQNGYSYRILEDAIQIFEEQNPGIQVEYVSGILKEDYSEWLAEQLLSENAPDVFWVLPEDFNDLAEIGALKDLTPFVTKDPEFHEEAFYSSAYKYGQYHETQYSLPFECAPKLMFVNKSILDQEGLELPGDDWTWETFYDICQSVTKDIDGNGTLDQFGAVGYTWKEAFDSNGVRLFNQQGTQCYLTGTQVEASLSFMEKLNKLNGDYNVTSKDFDLGKVAFQPMSFSQYRAYKPYPLSIKKYSNFEWECIPMPAGPEGENIAGLDTLLLAMNENTGKARYAWELMKILTCNTQIQSEIFDYSEGVSVMKEVTESDQILLQLVESSGDGNSMNLTVLSDAVEHASVEPRFRNYEEATAEVDKAITAILEGNSNISMDLIVWNRTINRYLKNRD